MLEFFTKIIDNGNLIDIISCVFTVAALIFTLYFWLLDHVNEEEAEFIKSKSSVLDKLNNSLKMIKEPECILPEKNDDPDGILQVIDDVNREMEVVLSYRFWTRGKQKEEYLKVNNFFKDSKYAVSTIRRAFENNEHPSSNGKSLVSIASLNKDELEDIRSDYQKGLSYTIEFIKNWE